MMKITKRLYKVYDTRSLVIETELEHIKYPRSFKGRSIKRAIVSFKYYDL